MNLRKDVPKKRSIQVLEILKFLERAVEIVQSYPNAKSGLICDQFLKISLDYFVVLKYFINIFGVKSLKSLVLSEINVFHGHIESTQTYFVDKVSH